MGTIRDRMEATSQQVLSARQARLQATADVQTHVGNLLSTYHRDRQAMASAMSGAFGQSRRARVESRHAESANTKRMMHSYHQGRVRAAREQRAALAANHRDRSRSVAALMHNFSKMQGHSAQQLNRNLKAFVHETQVGVSNLIKKAHTSRKNRGRELTRELRRANEAIRRRTTEIEMETRNQLARLSVTRHDMAKQLLNRLASSVQDRRRAVAQLLGGFHSAQDSLRKDLHNAHQTWQAATGTAMPMRSHAEPKKAPEAEQKHVAKREIAEMSHADQLAEILQIIGRQLEGVSAAQIAGAVGLSALQVGRLATELADSGKVRKDETTRRYFP